MKLATIAAAAAVAAWLGVQPARSADVLYVTAAKVIVDVTKPPIQSGAVVITDGIVTAAGANVPMPDGARRIDAGALTIMPSLIDAHTHLAGGSPGQQPGRPQPIASPASDALRSQKSVARALSLGVSAMRDMQSDDFVDVAIAQAIDDGTIDGPHVIPAAHALSVIGGHEDFDLLPYTIATNTFTPLRGFVASPADAEKAVQLQIRYGARVIKLMASGGVGSPLDYPSDPNMTLEEMRVAVEQAHMHHLKVAAHAENLQSVLDALKAGVDSIEHGSELNQEAVDYMKAHNVVLVPTVRVIVAGAANPPPPGTRLLSPFGQFKVKQLVEKHLAAFALALKNGVTIAAGSDTAYPPDGTGVFAEVVTLVEHGMPAQKALEAATIRGAALLDLNRLGTLASGMEGDLIAVEGDPLADIHALEKVRLVVFKGRVITDRRAGRAGPSQ